MTDSATLAQATTSSDSKLETLAARVADRRVGPCRLLTLATPVRDVVSFWGSLRTHPDFAAGDELVQTITVGLLDKGTRRRDRFAIADLLENRGAQLHFATEGLHIGFQGRALREDLPAVLEVLAEQLREPLFDAQEFEKMRVQYRGALQRTLDSTRSQASAALARRLYAPAHPNFIGETDDLLAHLDRLTVDDVRAYHARHVGADDLLLVLVGDLDNVDAGAVLEEAFGGWTEQAPPPAFAADAAPQPPGTADVPMPGKPNLDVYLGHALTLRRQDPDYLPLFLANHILGGNFSGRLMSHVRDELGLTYGIYSALNGVTTEYAGHWSVGVTLSREALDRGIEATRAEVRRFVEEGPTAREVEEAKTNLVGAFKVGLATTGGLAATLHLNATRGFDIGYLDGYPAEIEALTQEAVVEAVRRHFRPEQFHLVRAGDLSEEA